MTTPNALVGIHTHCPRCLALPGMRCTSGGGRTLAETHIDRFRVELATSPVRRWYAAQMAGRLA